MSARSIAAFHQGTTGYPLCKHHSPECRCSTWLTTHSGCHPHYKACMSVRPPSSFWWFPTCRISPNTVWPRWTFSSIGPTSSPPYQIICSSTYIEASRSSLYTIDRSKSWGSIEADWQVSPWTPGQPKLPTCPWSKTCRFWRNALILFWLVRESSRERSNKSANRRESSIKYRRFSPCKLSCWGNQSTPYPSEFIDSIGQFLEVVIEASSWSG